MSAANQTDTDFEVWKENAKAVEMFLKVQTQWVVGSGGVVGLNYQSVEFCLKIYRTKERREIFEALQVMELAALAVMNKREG